MNGSLKSGFLGIICALWQLWSSRSALRKNTVSFTVDALPLASGDMRWYAFFLYAQNGHVASYDACAFQRHPEQPSPSRHCSSSAIIVFNRSVGQIRVKVATDDVNLHGSRLPVRRILSCYAPPIQQRKERLQVSLYSATRYDTSSKTLAYGIDLSGTAMYRSRRITPSNFNSIQIPICSKWTRIKDGHDGMDVQNIPYPQDIAEPHAKS